MDDVIKTCLKLTAAPTDRQRLTTICSTPDVKKCVTDAFNAKVTDPKPTQVQIDARIVSFYLIYCKCKLSKLLYRI